MADFCIGSFPFYTDAIGFFKQQALFAPLEFNLCAIS